MHTLPALPYEYSALEPTIDAKTMEIHHTKHHQAYIDKLNAALQGHEDLEAQSVEDLLRGFESLPEAVKMAVRNHGGGHANHSLFWTILTPEKHNGPENALAEAIDTTFGSFVDFKKEFETTATGQFGSGWGWLVVNASGELELLALPNQDSPLMQGKTPILGVDVWEHAYYLKYQNKRPDYLAAIWDVINWDEVARRYEQAKA